MKNQVEERFSEFYENWVWKLEAILHQLLEASKQKTEVLNEQELKALVSRVTTHVKEFYSVKWASAHEDVLAFLSPVWLSPLENAYLWMTGWKPSAAFQLVESLKKTPVMAIGTSSRAFNMSEEQQKKVDLLRVKNKVEGEEVEREMERIQVAMQTRRCFSLRGCRAGHRGMAVVAWRPIWMCWWKPLLKGCLVGWRK